MKIACAFDQRSPAAAVRLRDADRARTRPSTSASQRPIPSTTPTWHGGPLGRSRGRRGPRVIVCGSGAGVAIARLQVPRHPSLRRPRHYTAHQAVEHDDGNVLCMAAASSVPLIAAEVLAAFCGVRSPARSATSADRKIADIEREFAPGA